ncbi:MAG: hypothetical protein IKR22_03415 [Clostridiales bacterium]|nr:hypothetical protein [Clostridiales bacterium]
MGMLVFIPALILGQYLTGWIRALFDYIYYHIRGAFCVRVAGIFIRWDKDLYDPVKPGKMKFTVSRLNQFYPMVTMTYPATKIRRTDVFPIILYTVMAIATMGLFLFLTAAKHYLFDDTLLMEFICGLLAGSGCVFTSSAYYGMKGAFSKNGLAEKRKEMTMSMAVAKSPDDLVLRPFDYPSYGSASVAEKLSYMITFYGVAEMKNDLMAMAECVNTMVRLGTGMLTDAGHFYLDSELFAYYSFRQKDPVLARRYYEHSKKNIDADMDGNGRRRLAYYAFYILEDRELARRYAQEGLRALTVSDPRVAPVSRDFEEKMLNYLLSQIDE